MTRDELRATVVRALTEVAPDVEPAQVAGDTRFREDLDLDSMDFLNLVAALHESTGVDVPERDYDHISTLDATVDYLAEATAREG